MLAILLNSFRLGVYYDVEAVELTDRTGTFGIRRLDTGDTVVDPGTDFPKVADGIYEYLFDDEADVLYEAAVKISRVSQEPVYIRYQFPLISVSEDSESVSVSTPSESPRALTITRGDLVPVTSPTRGSVFSLEITASNAVLMPSEIFVCLDRQQDPYDGDIATDLVFIATPFDSTVYPVGEAATEQSPPYYRKDAVQFLVPSSEIADMIWTELEFEVRQLIAAYDRLDVLKETTTVLLEGQNVSESEIIQLLQT